MSRSLYILRHGKSSWDSGAASDFERPLSKRGKHDAPRMGAWMAARGHVPDHVVTSPARRARKTAEKVGKAMGLLIPPALDPRIYAAQREDLLRVLAECPPAADRVLLVGHNPGLEDLLAYLWGDATVVPADGKLLPTATVAGLDLPADWSRLEHGCGAIRFLVRPKELPSDPRG